MPEIYVPFTIFYCPKKSHSLRGIVANYKRLCMSESHSKSNQTYTFLLKQQNTISHVIKQLFKTLTQNLHHQNNKRTKRNIRTLKIYSLTNVYIGITGFSRFMRTHTRLARRSQRVNS